MRENKGFSLIELIIVLAITSILGGAMWLGFQSLSSRQVRQCAKNIESFMGRTKTLALAKDKAWMKLYKKADGCYIDLYVGETAPVLQESKKIGLDSLKVSYETDVSGGTEIKDSAVLELSFKRDSGAFEPLGGGSFCKKIIIEKGSNKTELLLVAETGKYYIN